jgi:membrane protein implicated in regulation of membrane protease activity
MHFAGWELWIAAALLFAGAELTHGALFFLAIALACVPPAAASGLGAGVALQVLLFAVSLLVELPLVAHITARRRVRIATNAEAIIGRRVRVLQPVKENQDGVVLLTGEHWKARSLAGEIAPGAEAQVVQRDGMCLLVVPLEGPP